MRRLALALALTLWAGAAVAQVPPAPAKFLRAWDFGRDGEGEDTCTLVFRADTVIGGYGLTPRRNCRAVPGASDLFAWRPTADGGIALADATRRTIFAFAPDEGYRPRGWGFTLTARDGRLWVMNPTLGPPAPVKRKR